MATAYYTDPYKEDILRRQFEEEWSRREQQLRYEMEFVRKAPAPAPTGGKLSTAKTNKKLLLCK